MLLIDREAGVAAGPTRDSAAVVRMHYSEPVLVRMALESRTMFETMEEMLGRDGGFKRRGWFLVLPPEMMAAATRNVEMQRGMGLACGFLSDREIAEKAPWLNTEGIGGLLFEPDSGYADSVRTTEAFHFAFTQLGGGAASRRHAAHHQGGRQDHGHYARRRSL